jgi:hypothetical protein
MAGKRRNRPLDLTGKSCNVNGPWVFPGRLEADASLQAASEKLT